MGREPTLKASVIDLGYNSLKMVSYEVGPDSSVRAFQKLGALTKIGEGLNQTGFLGREPMERTLRELKLLNEWNRLGGINDVISVATSAVREAGNGEEFLRMARAETGLHFRVLSGEEEALFSYVGAARATRAPDALFFDLGGGSLEMVHASEYHVNKIFSLPLGALRLTELYGDGKKRFGRKDSDRMHRRVTELLPSRKELRLSKKTVLIGVGGTVRALAKYDQFLRDYPLNKLHNYAMSMKSVSSMAKTLRRKDVREIARIEPIGKDRAESITAGSLIIESLMERLRINSLVVSTQGLRDGVLAEYIGDRAAYHGERMTVSRANRSLWNRVDQRPGTEQLTVDLVRRGVLTPREKRILDEAVERFFGIYLSTREESLFYAVLNEDSALSHEDQLVLALAMVRSKAPKIAGWFQTHYGSMLDDTAKDSTERLVAFVKLAEILRITDSTASARQKGGGLVFEIKSARTGFPRMLVEQAARQVEEATGRAVRIRIRRRRLRMQIPRELRPSR